MNDNQILLLGLGLEAPWKLVDQRLDASKQPHELHLTIKGERGAQYPCPVCGALCKAHDFNSTLSDYPLACMTPREYH